QLVLRLHALVTAAFVTGRRDDLAFAVAAVAGADVDHRAEDGLLHAPHLAGAVALRAALWLRAWLRAASLADRAGVRASELDLLVHAEHRFFKADRQHVAQVGAPSGRAPLCGAAAREAAEQIFKNIAEAAKAAEVLRKAAWAGVTVAVVHLPLLAVAQDFVGLIDLFEAHRRIAILVAVGMKLHGEPAIRALDLLGARIARHTQHIVIVSLA